MPHRRWQVQSWWSWSPPLTAKTSRNWLSSQDKEDCQQTPTRQRKEKQRETLNPNRMTSIVRDVFVKHFLRQGKLNCCIQLHFSPLQNNSIELLLEGKTSDLNFSQLIISFFCHCCSHHLDSFLRCNGVHLQPFTTKPLAELTAPVLKATKEDQSNKEMHRMVWDIEPLLFRKTSKYLSLHFI